MPGFSIESASLEYLFYQHSSPLREEHLYELQALYEESVLCLDFMIPCLLAVSSESDLSECTPQIHCHDI